MTHGQKPESAEFRALETQVSECARDLHASLIALEEKLYVEFAEAEARGAAEQRRKDAEGAEAVWWVDPASFHNPLEQSGDHDRDRFAVMLRVRLGEQDIPLYTRPANVAALEDRVKELEGENKVWSGAAANALTWLENGRQANARDELKAAQRRVAAIREGERS